MGAFVLTPVLSDPSPRPSLSSLSRTCCPNPPLLSNTQAAAAEEEEQAGRACRSLEVRPYLAPYRTPNIAPYLVSYLTAYLTPTACLTPA